jgi:hypothetical protein
MHKKNPTSFLLWVMILAGCSRAVITAAMVGETPNIDRIANKAASL